MEIRALATANAFHVVALEVGIVVLQIGELLGRRRLRVKVHWRRTGRCHGLLGEEIEPATLHLPSIRWYSRGHADGDVTAVGSRCEVDPMGRRAL